MDPPKPSPPDQFNRSQTTHWHACPRDSRPSNSSELTAPRTICPDAVTPDHCPQRSKLRVKHDQHVGRYEYTNQFANVDQSIVRGAHVAIATKGPRALPRTKVIPPVYRPASTQKSPTAKGSTHPKPACALTAVEPSNTRADNERQRMSSPLSIHHPQKLKVTVKLRPKHHYWPQTTTPDNDVDPCPPPSTRRIQPRQATVAQNIQRKSLRTTTSI